MIKDYWVYQERQNEGVQWALYIVKEYQRSIPEATVLDYTVYSEDIGNATNSKSFVGLHYDTVGGYVNTILTEIMEFNAITSQDKEQLEREITRILQD